MTDGRFPSVVARRVPKLSSLQAQLRQTAALLPGVEAHPQRLDGAGALVGAGVLVVDVAEEAMSPDRLQFCLGQLETARLAISAETDIEHVQSLARRHGASAFVLASRALLRMNDGVGFLLRVTDVESQPFRAMGFVSVIIVSCLFALGLPLVLL